MTNTASPTDKVLLETLDGVAVLTLNRPDVRNAIDRETVDAMHDILARLAAEPEPPVLIVTGAGDKSFVAGADIRELRERTHAHALGQINTGLFTRLEAYPLPTIAAVNGYCLGGGCELALACDLRVAAEHAKFGQPEVGLGIQPAAGATRRLPRIVGLGKARELIFTGRIIDAAEALAIGLVNQVVPAADLMGAARALAAEIAANGSLAVRMAKINLNHSHELSESAAQHLESVSQAILFDSEDKVRRMTAFLEKRSKK